MFSAAPYRDFPFQRLFFNRVGQRFHIQPLARRDAVLRLIAMTRGFYRHNQAADLEAYLSFFSELAARRACYDLELSPDLSTLTQLVLFLQTP
jgi:hypothetical protein